MSGWQVWGIRNARCEFAFPIAFFRVTAIFCLLRAALINTLQ
jgi:hypothetical protein